LEVAALARADGNPVLAPSANAPAPHIFANSRLDSFFTV
jgi:hypothetical protein